LGENEKGADFVQTETEKIAKQLNHMEITHFGKRVRPPKGY
jgi:hypothetical protein